MTTNKLQGMAKYIGVKVLNAQPMTLGAYNAFRVWTMPVGENPEDEGYLVEYLDGGKANTEHSPNYLSWSPKGVFENTYKAFDEAKDIPTALAVLSAAMRARPEFAHTWHCAVACTLMDAGVAHGLANKHASHFMRSAFGVGDVEPITDTTIVRETAARSLEFIPLNLYLVITPEPGEWVYTMLIASACEADALTTASKTFGRNLALTCKYIGVAGSEIVAPDTVLHLARIYTQPIKPATFEERAVAEKAELVEKHAKLIAFFTTDVFASLPVYEQSLLVAQSNAMREYASALGARIQRFT
jgi:hypothetical protein